VKRVEAIVRAEKLSEVTDALVEHGLEAMTVSDVRGRGNQPGKERAWRGETYTVEMLPRSRVEIVVPDDLVDDVVETVVAAAGTGEVGDGKVFVHPVDRAVRIRTGEEGRAAVREPEAG
jgi:nitrogen regulatory protein P-II 1